MSVSIVPPSERVQAQSLGEPVRLLAPGADEERLALLRGAGGELDPLQLPSAPISSRIGSSRTRTPAPASTSRSPFSWAGPVGEEHHSLLQPESTSAERAAAGPSPWIASGRSRTSQPSQKGQWKTV